MYFHDAARAIALSWGAQCKKSFERHSFRIQCCASVVSIAETHGRVGLHESLQNFRIKQQLRLMIGDFDVGLDARNTRVAHMQPRYLSSECQLRIVYGSMSVRVDG